MVTEWQAQILEDSQGKRYVAPFLEGVTRRGMKNQVVDLECYCMLIIKKKSGIIVNRDFIL